VAIGIAVDSVSAVATVVAAFAVIVIVVAVEFVAALQRLYASAVQ